MISYLYTQDYSVPGEEDNDDDNSDPKIPEEAEAVVRAHVQIYDLADYCQRAALKDLAVLRLKGSWKQTITVPASKVCVGSWMPSTRAWPRSTTKRSAKAFLR